MRATEILAVLNGEVTPAQYDAKLTHFSPRDYEDELMEIRERVKQSPTSPEVIQAEGRNG